MQDLWKYKLHWDESVPSDIQTRWIQFVQKLEFINCVKVPRKIASDTNNCTFEIHGFSDASQVAYGCCIYVRSTNVVTNAESTSLLCAKSRIAPLKTQSLPRLELCAALLLAQLASKAVKSIGIPFKKTCYYSDSTITLAWIRSPPSKWKTFIANRVSEIQDLTEISDWYHIDTSSNPADIISRGIAPDKIIDNDLWWSGPDVLDQRIPHFNPLTPDQASLSEAKALIIIKPFISDQVISRFSCLYKLYRVIALCKRLISNFRLRRQGLKSRTGILLVSEICDAKTTVVKMVQYIHFDEEFKSIKAEGQVNKGSKLYCLNPFLDENEVIRVGGRLGNSKLSYSTRFPIVLPNKHVLTDLIIKHTHEDNCHAGAQATLAAIRSEYWILSARNRIRKIIRNCLICVKNKPRLITPMMGNLPQYRTEATRPFLKVGIDYCGPFDIKEGSRRSKRTVKAYVIMFVCLSTKAVHIELTSDLTTDTFLSALRRMMSRRGMITDLYSDNAKNFQGADTQLMDLNRLFCIENKELANSLVKRGINWHFIPPRAPHFGGIWEASVKSTKHHLRRVVGNALLTYEEMYTILTQIEGILNSRPLTPISNDPNDYTPLTPGHFLIGEPLNALAEPSLIEIKINRLSRWQHLQQMRQHFWKRWSAEYLTELQKRSKWARSNGPMVKVGQLVIMKEDNLPPLKWKTGRIEEVHPGNDDVIRVVTIRTTNGTFKRSLHRLCLLPETESAK